MKRIFLVILSVLMVSAIILVGCGKPAEETPTPPTPPEEEIKPIEWTFVSFIPPFDVYAVKAQDWAKRVEEATGGRLKVTFYWAESLVKISGLFEAVSSGTADMGQHPLAFYPERLSLAWIGTLPGIFESTPQAGKTVLALFNKYKEFGEQFSPCKVAWVQTPGPAELTSKKPVRTMEDLKGLKIATGMKFEMLAWEALGAVPVPVHVTEMYQGLETGVIDAACLDFNAFYLWRLHEVTQYRVGNTIGTMLFYLTELNIDSYNKLPDDIKKIYDELTDPVAYSTDANEAFAAFAAGSIEEIKKYDKEVGNPEFYYLTAEEHQRWIETIWPINDVWVQENEARGYPAKAMLEDAVAFAKQYK